MYSKIREQIETILHDYQVPPELSERLLELGRHIDVEAKGCISWCVDDVIKQGKERFKMVLSDQRAQEILETMIDRHDPEYGISWKTIDDCIWEDMGDAEKDNYEELIESEKPTNGEYYMEHTSSFDGFIENVDLDQQ